MTINNNGYLKITDDVMKAVKYLNKDALGIYLYFSSTGHNSNIIDYKDIEDCLGIDEHTRIHAFKELEDKGYIIKKDKSYIIQKDNKDIFFYDKD